MLIAAEDEECLDRLVTASCRKSTPDDGGKPTVCNTTDPENEQALPPTKVFTQTRKRDITP